MLYSLQKTYTTKVLKENTEPNSNCLLEFGDQKKAEAILSDALKDIVKMVDEPTSDFEELLLNIRDAATNALIDSGVEKD